MGGITNGSVLLDGTVIGSKIKPGAISWQQLSKEVKDAILEKDKKNKYRKINGDSIDSSEFVISADEDYTLKKCIYNNIQLMDITAGVESDRSCTIIYQNLSEQEVTISINPREGPVWCNIEKYDIPPGNFVILHVKSCGKDRFLTFNT